MAIRLFCSYSHKDEHWKNRLETHFAPLKHSNLIEFWHDQKIPPGDTWQAEIDQNINTADIIVLLISADFLASDYCFNYELKIALERRCVSKTLVIPIILRPCDWKSTPIGALQALPKDGKPVSEYPDEDQAFNEITTKFRQIIEMKRDEGSHRCTAPQRRDLIEKTGYAPYKNFQLDSQHKAKLVTALLECSAMRDRDTRNAIVDELPSEIRNTIQRHSADRVHVNNIVSRCQDFKGGISKLMIALENFEGPSLALENLKAFLMDMKYD
jgi:hypothetical protein